MLEPKGARRGGLWSSVRPPFLGSVALLLAAPWLGTPQLLASPRNPEDSKKKEEEEGKTVLESPDVQYVKDNLEKYLHPTKLEFLDDGRVKMVFSFREKSEDHESIFTRHVGGKMQDPFRWSIRDEEMVIGGDVGLRVSNRGIVLLKAWFVDDVEAEMEFLQYVNWIQRHVAALVFCNDKGKSIGSNFGTQCAVFSGGRLMKAAGKAEGVAFDSTAKIGFVIRDEKFAATRNGRSRQELKYPKKSFASGRVGFVWGGSLSGIIPSLTVTGKLDYERMAKAIRKGE